MCGTGIGMSIAANKVEGIRCAKVSNENEARLAREHNNANIIAISYTTPINDIKEMVRIFLKTSFSNEERHIRRINKITEYERVNHES
jgi:ribose 5-phosphate isomerase B